MGIFYFLSSYAGLDCTICWSAICFLNSGVVGAIRKYTPYAYFFPRAVCVLRLLRINICVYPLVLLLRKSVIYCSFPYNGVPYSCVKLMILCCNWCIITSVILPFPAHHRLSARVRCIERTPLNAAFVFSPTSRESLLAIGSTGTFPVDRSSSEPIAEARKTSPTLGTVFKLFYSELQKANTPKVWIGAMQCIRQPRAM